jgi:RNA polymerase sigma-70 factor (ECF subfamily)
MSEDSATALARLFDEHVWDVYGFVAYRVDNRVEAEDLTQQTFERALRAWSRFDPSRAQPRTWLLAIARNLVVDHYRRDRSMMHRPLSEEGEEVVTQEGPEAAGVSPELSSALATLSNRDREIVALRFGADLRGPEIAELLSLTLANVQQILSRSLRRLRAELEGAEGRLSKPKPRPSGREWPQTQQTGGGNHEKQRAARGVPEDHPADA